VTIYALLWKRSADKGKARWEKIGIMMEEDDGKKSVKMDLVPVGQWDGWLVVSERKAKEDSGKEPSFSSEPDFRKHSSLSLSLQ